MGRKKNDNKTVVPHFTHVNFETQNECTPNGDCDSDECFQYLIMIINAVPYSGHLHVQTGLMIR